MALLDIRHVAKAFRSRRGTIDALSDVSLTVESGQSVGLIGESGSGKSTLGRVAVMLARPDTGTVHFDGRELTALSDREVAALRSRMQVVFQEPYESLNPRMRIGQIVEEPLAIHSPSLDRAERRRQTIATLEMVGLDQSYLRRFPRELSGGQQQRVGIARAVATRPSLVVLDEPTSSLDVSVRALILQLLRDLQNELGLAYLFISHDISTVEYFCRQTAVMYRGRIVESGDTGKVLGQPRHPYTQALLSANLSIDPSVKADHLPLKDRQFTVPDLTHECVLVGRCPIEIDDCRRQRVDLRPVGVGHQAACLRTGAAPVAAGTEAAQNV